MEYPVNNESSEALEKVIEPKSVSFLDEILNKQEEELEVCRVADELDIGNLMLNRAVSMDLSAIHSIISVPVQAQINEVMEVEEA